MIRNLLVILLSASMLMQAFDRYFIWADFQLNRNYIAKNLCENRDRPWLHCNGQCQLMKKMKQEGKKDQGVPNRKSSFNEDYSCNAIPKFFNPVPVITFVSYGYLISPHPVDRSFPIFHPPPGNAS